MNDLRPASFALPLRHPALAVLAVIAFTLTLVRDAPVGLALEQTPPPQDAILGKWLSPDNGNVDFPSPLGFEITRDAQGELQGFIYNPMLHVYGGKIGRPVLTGPNRYKVTNDNLEFGLGPDDTFVLMGFSEKPLVFARTAVLPAPPSPKPLPSAPEPSWQVRLGGALFAPPVVRDGSAYIGNMDGVLFAIKTADGSVLWTFSAGRPIYGEALATDDAVYFACDNGYLFKLDRRSGKEIWRYDLGDARVSRVPPNPHVYDYDWRAAAPLLVEATIYIGSGADSFHAVDAVTGKPVWRVASNAAIRNAAVRHGRNVVFATMEGWVCAVDLLTGREAWSFKRATAYTSGPAVFEDAVIVGNRGSRFRALEANSGTELWSQSFLGSWIESTAVFRDDRGYVGSGDLFLVSSFNPMTGKPFWRTDVGGWVLQRPALTEHLVLVGVSAANRRDRALRRQNGSITALDRSTGRILWAWSMPEWPGAFLRGFFAAPVVVEKTVLAAGLDGTLYAFPLVP